MLVWFIKNMLTIRAEERLRVSADVHDIVSHTLSMIAVRSGVARMVLDRRPDEARVALASIPSFQAAHYLWLLAIRTHVDV